MDSFIKADIFFFITTIAVIVISFLLTYAIFEAIRILRDLKKISGRFREEGEKIANDIGELRENVKNSPINTGWLWNLLLPKTKRKTNKRENDL